MNRRGLTWTVAGTVGLVLIVLGIHLAWEWQRNRLETARGTLRVGMTVAEAKESLGPPCDDPWELTWIEQLNLYWGHQWLLWTGDGRRVVACFGEDGRLTGATVGDTRIPRPSLVEHVRSWFTAEGEE